MGIIDSLLASVEGLFNRGSRSGAPRRLDNPGNPDGGGFNIPPLKQADVATLRANSPNVPDLPAPASEGPRSIIPRVITQAETDASFAEGAARSAALFQEQLARKERKALEPPAVRNPIFGGIFDE